jgi:hypothetical protein
LVPQHIVGRTDVVLALLLLSGLLVSIRRL